MLLSFCHERFSFGSTSGNASGCRSAISSQVIQLHQFFDDGLFPALFNTLRDAVLEMLFEKQALKLFNRLAHRIGLAQNIDTILIRFDHLTNATDMALNIIQPLEGFLFIRTHELPHFLSYPPGRGTPLHNYTTSWQEGQECKEERA